MYILFKTFLALSSPFFSTQANKRTNDQADLSIQNPPPKMSAAELRRRSVLAAQRPLQVELVPEAGRQDGAAAEVGNVVDIEKGGEAEEVVSTDEEASCGRAAQG